VRKETNIHLLSFLGRARGNKPSPPPPSSSSTTYLVLAV